MMSEQVRHIGTLARVLDERDAEITRLREALTQARAALKIIAGIRTPYDLLVTNKEVALEGLRKSALPIEGDGR